MRVRDFHPSYLFFFAPDLFEFLLPSRLESQWSGGKSVLGTEWLLTTPSSLRLALRTSALVMFSLIYVFKHAYSAYFMPGTIPSTLQVLTYSVLPQPQGR